MYPGTSALDAGPNLKGIAEMALSVHCSISSSSSSSGKEQLEKSYLVSTLSFSLGDVSGNAGESYILAWLNLLACPTTGLLDTAAACSDGFSAYYLALENLDVPVTLP